MHNDIKVEILGDTTIEPTVAFVVGVHGNENAPLKAVAILREKIKKKPINTSIKIIYANTLAINRNLRYIEKDLNTCFFQNSGLLYEENLVSSLLAETKKTKYNFDFHTTDFDIDNPYGLISIYNENVRDIIIKLPVENYIFTDKECLIKYVPNGIGFEIGKNSDSMTVQKTIFIMESIIKATNMPLGVSQNKDSCPNLFLIYKLLRKEKYIELNEKMGEFKKITSGDLIGVCQNGTKEFASEVCYPMRLKEKKFIRIAKKIIIDE